MKKFGYICFKCNDDAKKTKEYKGVVNLDIRPGFIRHFCFTCKNKEIVKLMPTPLNKKEFLKGVREQEGYKES